MGQSGGHCERHTVVDSEDSWQSDRFRNAWTNAQNIAGRWVELTGLVGWGGRSPEEANQLVQTAGLATGAAALGVGAALGLRRRWLPALGLIGAGAVAIAAALDKLR